MPDIAVHFVESVDDAFAFLRWLGERRPILAIDTETTGLDWWTQDFARLVQFGDGEQGWSISSRHWRGVIDQALAEYTGPVVMHNAKFDMHALSSSGYQAPSWGRVHDTVVMHHLLEPHMRHGLKPIAGRLIGWEYVAGQDLLKKQMREGKWNWATVPVNLPAYWQYAALDTVLTAQLAEILSAQLTPALWSAYEVEMRAMAVLHRAEERGLRIDPTYTELLRNEWAVEAGKLHNQLVGAGIRNPNSNAEVTAALTSVGWEPEEFTPTGAAKLDKVVLQALIAKYGDIAPALLRYRRIRKWTSTYLDTFLRDRDSTDHLHASINTMAARTGRMSITNPPLQTLPRGPEIRKAVIADEDEVIYAIDYDAQELRVMAHYSGEPELQRAIAEGKDMHRYAASLVYGVPYNSIGKDDPRRQVTKNTQYGLTYGAGASKIAETAGIDKVEAEAFIDSYFTQFPGVKEFLTGVVYAGRVRLQQEGQGYVTTVGGRRVVADSDKLYSLVNYLIQGSCADLLKQKIVAIDAAGYGDFILLPVHDELLLSVPDDEDGHDAARTIGQIMEEYDLFDVPLTCETTGPLHSWGAKYEEHT